MLLQESGSYPNWETRCVNGTVLALCVPLSQLRLWPRCGRRAAERIALVVGDYNPYQVPPTPNPDDACSAGPGQAAPA